MTPQICWPGKKGCWSRKHQLRGAQSLHPPICMSDSSPSLSTLFTAGKGQDYMMRCCNQEGPCMCTLLLNTVVSSLGTALYTLHLRFQVGRRDLPPTEVLWWLCSCWVHRGGWYVSLRGGWCTVSLTGVSWTTCSSTSGGDPGPHFSLGRGDGDGTNTWVSTQTAKMYWTKNSDGPVDVAQTPLHHGQHVPPSVLFSAEPEEHVLPETPLSAHLHQ